jgi:hypothetical protein
VHGRRIATQKKKTITAMTARRKNRIATGSGTRRRCSHSTPGRIAAAKVSASST